MLTDQFFVVAEKGHDVTLLVLIVLSIFSIAFIIERYLALKAMKENSKKVTAQVSEILKTSDFSQVQSLANETETFEGRAVNYAMRYIKENGDQGIDEVFQTYALTERPKLEKSLNFLATVGSNAPFIGLLGTVFGIMDAFRGLATSQGDAAAVMIGISKALVATAVGLLVAIPAVIAFNAYQKQVKSIMQSLESAKELCLAYVKSNKR